MSLPIDFVKYFVYLFINPNFISDGDVIIGTIKVFEASLKVTAITSEIGGDFFLEMFSYFDDGIKNIYPKKTIDLSGLVKLIRVNPHKTEIENIRYLRRIEDDSYHKLKKELPHITPNSIVRERCLDKNPGDMEKNLIGFSQYVYFDIDGIADPIKYKKYIIEKYGHQVSMVCLSTSNGGVSILFKVSNTITIENFEAIRMEIRNTILKDETIDTQSSNIGRAMFISSDPDVYVNYDNEIEVELTQKFNSLKGKSVKQYNSFGGDNNTLFYTFRVMPINEVLQKMHIKTQVQVDNPIVDHKPVEFAKVFIPEVIKDGTKHKKYTSMIHTLAYINPNIDRDYIFSYLFYVNNRFARPRMEHKELCRLVTYVLNNIEKTGTPYCETIIKYVHFNPQCELTSKEKGKIANELNGYYRRYKTINRIQEVKQELQQMGVKVTQKKVAKMSDLTLKTVQTHFKAEQIDMEWVVQQFNLTKISEENGITPAPTRKDFKDICKDM